MAFKIGPNADNNFVISKKPKIINKNILREFISSISLFILIDNLMLGSHPIQIFSKLPKIKIIPRK